jgi:hypothetical protein
MLLVPVARRRILRLIALAGALPLLAAFSPRGLDIWRQHSLFILFQDRDLSDRELLALVSERLLAKLPASRAEPLAVSDLRQIGELLLSRQYDFALLRISDVVALTAVIPQTPDPATGPIVLLASFRDHLLICRSDLPADHAEMIAAALADVTAQSSAGASLPLTWHPAVGD